jgi:hypothetical protein
MSKDVKIWLVRLWEDNVRNLQVGQCRTETLGASPIPQVGWLLELVSQLDEQEKDAVLLWSSPYLYLLR